MKKLIVLVVSLSFVLLILAACTGGEEPVSEPDSDIAGIVLEVANDGTSILVDSATAVANGQIWVTINEDTIFGLGTSSEFEVDNFVEITVEGGIMESYPMQAVAARVCTNEPLVD